MILAAGVGSRLDPLTRILPKPLVPVLNRPVMEHVIAHLARHGFRDILINVHYLGKEIQAYFGDGNRFDVDLTWIWETQLWGDAGSVRRALDQVGADPVLVLGADDLSSIDLTAMVAFHKEKGAVVTAALSRVDNPSDYGIAQIDAAGLITRYVEKPKGEALFSNLANTGIYVLEPSAIERIPNTFHVFGKQFFPALVAGDARFYGFETRDYWRDVGDLDGYLSVHRDGLTGAAQLQLPERQWRKQVWVGENVEIDPTAEIGYPVVLGDNCRIEAGARVLEYSVLGAGAAVENGTVIRESILWDGAVAMRGTWLERCVVGLGCRVKSNAAVFNGVIVNPERAG